EQQTTNFEFRWKESRTYGKGSQFVLPSTTRSPSPTAKNDGGTQKIFPSEDVTQNEIETTVSVQNDLMRMTTDAPRWNPKYGLFVKRNYISTFDGMDCKIFYDRVNEDTPGDSLHQIGFVDKEEYNKDVADFHIWPVLLTYRATNAMLAGIRPRRWPLTDE